MKFPKKTNYMLILFLIALSLMLRFPNTPHSVGVDAFVMQGLANCIVRDGYAAWIIHPLSYLGLYPLSYPSGGIFLPASFVALSGHSSEVSILALSFLMGIIGVLGAYLLAREFKDDDVFAFLVAFLFCLAPKFILNTTWETPTRGGFMAFTPIFLWALLRAHRQPSRKNIAMTITMLFILATFHRLAILMLIVILAYVFTYIFLIIVKIAKLKMPALFLRPRARSKMRLFGVAALLGLGILLMFGSGVLESYEWGKIAHGTSLLIQLLNLGTSLTRSAGALTPFLLVGAVVLAYQRNKTLKESFILFIVLAIIPTLYLRKYTGFYVPIFISLLAGMGIVGIVLVSKNRKRTSAAIVISILLVASVLTVALLGYESQGTKYMTREEYNTGLYARSRLNGTIFANNGLFASRVSAISGLPYLPVGGATIAGIGPEQLAYGFVLQSEVHVVQVPIDKLTIDSDSPFAAVEVPNPQSDYGTIHDGILDSPTYHAANELLARYDVQYALEDKATYGHYSAFKKTYYSRFLSSVHNQRYKLYESGRTLIWPI
ncbi:MAG: DUF6541 family protein [Thermoplasmata archaeon]